MTIVSTELRQVFRAYTKQLRGQYAKTIANERSQETRARGFERVEISHEARALAAAGLAEMKAKEATHTRNHKSGDPKSKDDEEVSKKAEKESTSPKDDLINSRNGQGLLI